MIFFDIGNANTLQRSVFLRENALIPGRIEKNLFSTVFGELLRNFARNVFDWLKLIYIDRLRKIVVIFHKYAGAVNCMSEQVNKRLC